MIRKTTAHELTTIFTHDIPVLFLFYHGSKDYDKIRELEHAFEEIHQHVLVMLAEYGSTWNRGLIEGNMLDVNDHGDLHNQAAIRLIWPHAGSYREHLRYAFKGEITSDRIIDWVH